MNEWGKNRQVSNGKLRSQICRVYISSGGDKMRFFKMKIKHDKFRRRAVLEREQKQAESGGPLVSDVQASHLEGGLRICGSDAVFKETQCSLCKARSRSLGPIQAFQVQVRGLDYVLNMEDLCPLKVHPVCKVEDGLVGPKGKISLHIVHFCNHNGECGTKGGKMLSDYLLNERNY